MNGLLEVEKPMETQSRDFSDWNTPGTQKPNQPPQELTRTELQQELSRLMGDQIRSLEWQSFVGIDADELLRQEKRLKRIREISAELILAMRKTQPGLEVLPTSHQRAA